MALRDTGENLGRLVVLKYIEHLHIVEAEEGGAARAAQVATLKEIEDQELAAGAFNAVAPLGHVDELADVTAALD